MHWSGKAKKTWWDTSSVHHNAQQLLIAVKPAQAYGVEKWTDYGKIQFLAMNKFADISEPHFLPW